MSRRWKGAVAVLSLGLVLGTSIPTAAAVRVRMRDGAAADQNFYRPRRVVVEKGARVVWVNRGARPHTTTSNSGVWDSGTLQPGETFRRRFRKSGVFRYHCEIHDGMTGKIVVMA